MNMILAVMYREFRIRATGFVWIFFDLVMPLVYLSLFGVGLDKAMAAGVATEGARLSYQTFFLAGVLSMACFGIAINTSYGFFVDRDNGIFYEFLTYPMTRGQFLIGKIVFNCLLALVQSVITISFSVLLLEIPMQWHLTGLTLIGIIVGTAGWFFFLSMLALRIRRSDVYNTVLNIAYFVLMFASSMFYPLDSMPRWLHTLSLLNPLTWHTDGLRYATIGVGNVETIMIEAAAFGVFCLISFWLAVRTLYNVVVK
ncbi:MAG: ABC transporter permease [Ignavibacteriae bacterium]|nr:ABC transporter permease [Ignavibacteriota bacterium]